MSECIVCLENCQDKMKCCDAPIHAGCMGAILEEGFKQCPHCRKDMYTVSESVETPSESTALVRFTATPIVYTNKSACGTILEAVGIFTLVTISVNLMFGVY